MREERMEDLIKIKTEFLMRFDKNVDFAHWIQTKINGVSWEIEELKDIIDKNPKIKSGEAQLFLDDKLAVLVQASDFYRDKL